MVVLQVIEIVESDTVDGGGEELLYIQAWVVEKFATWKHQ